MLSIPGTFTLLMGGTNVPPLHKNLVTFGYKVKELITATVSPALYILGCLHRLLWDTFPNDIHILL